MILWAALVTTLGWAQGANPPPLELKPQDEVALHAFMATLFKGTQGDARKGRRYLPAAIFQESEVARLVAMSRDIALWRRETGANTAGFEQAHQAEPEAAKRSPRILFRSPINENMSTYLRERVGEELYSRLLKHCRDSIKMRASPLQVK